MRLASSSQTILALQCLRGIAAGMVVADHLIERLVRRGVYPEQDFSYAVSLGHRGVAVFFVISGLIMVYTTIGEFGKPGAPGRFFKRRFLRIAPLYYLTTAAMIAFHYATSGTHDLPSTRDLARSILFVPYSNGEGLLQPVYALGWTLEYELFFYALFAIGLRFPQKVGLALITAALLLLVGLGATVVDANAPSGPFHYIAVFFTRPIMLYFVMGVALGLARASIGETLSTRIPDWLTAACIALALVLTAYWNEPAGFLVVLACTAAAGLVTQAPPRTGWFARFSRLLGDTSYSLYLTHSFILGAVAWLMARAPAQGPLGLALQCAVAFGVSLLVAMASWRWLEQPIAAWVRKLRMARVSPAALAP